MNTIRLGEKDGRETLSASQMPSHTHTANLNSIADVANTTIPVGSALGITAANLYYSGSNTSPNQALQSGSVTVDSAGSGSDVNIRNPYVAVNYIIALIGTYPSRN